ncbi:DoxX family protein [Acidobacteria bacterium AB60]|nr:DoxX family protein [Acidobacteria bacterium AB60]
MKIVVLIARILLGLAFVVFGLDKLVHFFPVPPQQPGVAGEFSHAMMTSHYMAVVGVFEFTGGLLLLIGRFVPLGLCLLAPVIVNILTFDILMMPSALTIGLVVLLLWLLIFYRERSAFAGIFRAKAA